MIEDLTGRDKVCKLNKALYGLRQTGRQWNAKLHEAIINLGLKATNADPCVYIDQQGNELTILVYVDDILLASTNRGRVKQIKEKLARRFALRDLGQAKFCLGIEIQRVHNKIILSQTSYIRDVLQRFNMNTCNAISTPMSVAGKISFPNNDLRDERSNEEIPFGELIGALMYLSVATRPNISHTGVRRKGSFVIYKELQIMV